MTTIEEYKEMKTIECTCQKCREVCQKARPCWGTIAEIKTLIDHGFGHRLMLEWFSNDNDKTFILLLVPALREHEGKVAPYFPEGHCNFFNYKRLCEIHFEKPLEGRVTDHTNMGYFKDFHNVIARSWDCEEGRALIEAWRLDHNVKGLPPGCPGGPIPSEEEMKKVLAKDPAAYLQHQLGVLSSLLSKDFK